MGALDVAADQRRPRDIDARVKAAAWAWYQRGGGSIAAGAGRSEAFATRCSASLSASRFQREAAEHTRSRAALFPDALLTSSSSSMDNFLGSSSSLSRCTTFPGDLATDGSEEAGSVTDGSRDAESHRADDSCQDHPSLDLVSMDPAAFWDCGSSLFDTFELVAMSKRLDAELQEPCIDGEFSEGVRPVGSFLTDNQPKLFLCDSAFDANSTSPPSSPPSVLPPSTAENQSPYDVLDKFISLSDKQSKQAIYDMFCQYGKAGDDPLKQSSNRSPPAADTTCGGEPRKPKTKQGRVSLQALAKVLYSLKRLQANATSKGEAASEGEEPHDHHHHHLHYSPQPQPQPSATMNNAIARGIGGSMRGTKHNFTPDDVLDVPLAKARHIHHHHHHHYHYLFHSDDDYRLQPPDKSLMVAAAGLRSSKSITSISGYLEPPARGDSPVDFGRKLVDFAGSPSPNF